jgi:cytidylate kinase
MTSGADAPRVVAIDGAAGSGKSTLARGLASRLRLPYVNTGLMYRALTLAAIRSKVDPDHAQALAALARRLRFGLDRGNPPELTVDGSRPGPELAGADVETLVSAVARHPVVREVLRDEQRRLGADGCVMEGRDIASVVFPDVPVKLFLIADEDRRVARRAGERAAGDDVRRALLDRDRRDEQTNPLVPAPGSVVLDTTNLDVDGTLAAALAVIEDHAPDLLPERRA